MSQFGVISFQLVGVGFAFRNSISVEVIPRAIIGIEGVAIILLGLRRIVYQLLNVWLRALQYDFPAPITVGLPIYEREDADPVFCCR